MRNNLVRTLLFTLSAFVFLADWCRAQDKPAVPATPLEQLEAISTNTSLDGAGMSPWHLRMTFDLFDLKGSPKESGSIDEWWVSPASRRIVITSPSYNSTIPAAPGENPIFNRESYLVGLLLQQVVHPIPNYGSFDGLQVNPSKHKFGKVELACLAVTKPAMAGSKANPSGNTPAVPEFCAEPSAPILRVHLDSGGFDATRNNLARFMGKSLAMDNRISYEGRMAIKGHVETLSSYRPDQAPVQLTSAQPNAFAIPGIVLAGRRIKGGTPVYPSAAKYNHVSGSVVLCGIIAKDGTIETLDVVSTPDEELSKSSLDAVRQWIFAPYLLDGEPTKIETTITVNYNLSSSLTVLR